MHQDDDSASSVIGEKRTAAKARGLFSFIRAHFQGDYSLGRSYWGHALPASFIVPILTFLFVPWLSNNFAARHGSSAIIVLSGLSLIIWFWAVKGTWASASRHVERGGSRSWVIVVKVLLVFGALKTFGDVYGQRAVLDEYLQVALGKQFGLDTRFQVRADGRSILLFGGINDGAADRLERELQVNSGITTVVLDSEGGWVREGNLIANVIRKRQLNTYVERTCASACVLAFLAGKERAAAPNAKLGFHTGRRIGTSATASVDASDFEAVYRSAGLSESFIRQAASTPYSSMWHPSHAEMLSAGVLTRRSFGGETAAIATEIKSKEAVVRGFTQFEAFAILAQRDPQAFNQVVEAAWAQAQKGATDAEVLASARAHLMVILPRYFVLATDATLVEYQALIVDQLKAARAKDAGTCVELAFPSGNPIRIATAVSHDLQLRELSLLTKMMKEVDPARRIYPSTEAVASVAQRATLRMTPDQFRVFADAAARANAPASSVCDAAVAFMMGLNEIPLAERGSSLRVLYSAP